MTGRRVEARRRAGGAFGVVLVLVTAGYLFAANARLQGGADARAPVDLVGLVQAQLDDAAEAETLVAELRSEVDALTDDLAPQTAAVGNDELLETGLIALAAGRLPVQGPGLTVRLTDASPTAPRPDWVTNNDLVVHQQDLQAVINALWTGGAEAMSLQDQRVVSTSAFRCVGNVLKLHGRVYSPPYVVQAIGDPDELRAALLGSPAVQTYVEWAEVVGLGWSVAGEDALTLAAYDASVGLRHASVPAGITVPGVGVDAGDLVPATALP